MVAGSGLKLKCSFNIFFTSASEEVNYSAQVVINSTRPVEGSENRSLMLNIMDSKWTFQYQKNQSIYFNPTDFSPLTSFLDFLCFSNNLEWILILMKHLVVLLIFKMPCELQF